MHFISVRQLYSDNQVFLCYRTWFLFQKYCLIINLMLFLSSVLRLRSFVAVEIVSLRLGCSCVIYVTMMYINKNITGVFCADFLKEVPAISQNAREMWV